MNTMSRKEIKQKFVVSQLLTSFQKIVFAILAFAMALLCAWIIYTRAEFNILNFLLCQFMLLFLFCGFLCLFGYNGVDVYPDTYTWRSYLGLLGLKFGKTKHIPKKLDFILVHETSVPQMEDMDMGNYEVSVVYRKRKKMVFLESPSKKEAIRVADKLKVLFELEVIVK